jgi:hypothetical protein
MLLAAGGMAEGFRREVQWKTQTPSDYIREQMRFSLRPLLSHLPEAL